MAEFEGCLSPFMGTILAVPLRAYSINDYTASQKNLALLSSLNALLKRETILYR